MSHCVAVCVCVGGREGESDGEKERVKLLLWGINNVSTACNFIIRENER